MANDDAVNRILALKEGPDALKWNDAGFERLNTGLQKDLFDAGAKQLGVPVGQDANETAGNIISHITAPLGTSKAADVLRTALQTGATVGLNPANLIAPAKNPLLAGTVQRTEGNIAKKLAEEALKTGDMSTVNAIVKQHGDDTLKLIERSAPTGLDYIIGKRQPISNRAIKIITGSNEIPTTNIKPPQYRPPLEPIESAIKKGSTALAAGERVSTAPGVSTRGYDINKVLEILNKRGQR